MNHPHTLSAQSQPFLRHIERCRNITLPAGRLPLYEAETLLGWLDPSLRSVLMHDRYKHLITLDDKAAHLVPPLNLRQISLSLADEKLYHPFHEWFDVRTPQGIILDQIDRGLIPLLGVEASGVHLNGLVRKQDTLFLWVAQRSRHKRLDPGKLDHLVAGGMSSGFTPDETIIKEAGEEASIPPAIAQHAQHVSTLHYAMLRPEGLRRDRLYCYDLFLPEDFVPLAADGEVESFHLMPLLEVFHHIKETDNFKFNVNLVLIDLFLRYGLFPKHDESIIRSALYP